MRIKHKLFLLILVANITLALIMYVLTLHSFSDGFIHYLEKTESQKLTPFIKELALIYDERGDWGWTKIQHNKWRSLIDKQRHRLPIALHPSEYERLSINPIQKMQSHEQENKLLVINSHIYLKDKLNKLIIGNPNEVNAVHWIPITNVDEIVGYIGYVKKNILSNQLDTLFVQEQQKNFLLIALSLILLSAMFALPAASLFLRPLNRVSTMLRQIAKGDFTKRLKIKSRDEIGDLSKDLNSLAITLEKNPQWVADISHELRTPVAILKGEIEAIQDGVRSLTKTTLSSLHYEIERLTRIINDLHQLTLADIGELSYQKETLDFYSLLQERIDLQKGEIQRAVIKVTIYCPKSPVTLIGDAKRLEQLIDNLLQNSMRYTNNGGVLNISLMRKNKVYIFTWEDSSPGVSDSDLEKLTEPLYRAEQSRNRDTGGSGLGLAICKKIVEAHRGIISVEHSVFGGVAIKITFPVSQL